MCVRIKLIPMTRASYLILFDNMLILNSGCTSTYFLFFLARILGGKRKLHVYQRKGLFFLQVCGWVILFYKRTEPNGRKNKHTYVTSFASEFETKKKHKRKTTKVESERLYHFFHKQVFVCVCVCLGGAMANRTFFVFGAGFSSSFLRHRQHTFYTYAHTCIYIFMR